MNTHTHIYIIKKGYHFNISERNASRIIKFLVPYSSLEKEEFTLFEKS